MIITSQLMMMIMKMMRTRRRKTTTKKMMKHNKLRLRQNQKLIDLSPFPFSHSSFITPKAYPNTLPFSSFPSFSLSFSSFCHSNPSGYTSPSPSWGCIISIAGFVILISSHQTRDYHFNSHSQYYFFWIGSLSELAWHTSCPMWVSKWVCWCWW